MIPINANQLLHTNSRPASSYKGAAIQAPIFVDFSESEDSFYYGAPEPLERSEGEIGGDIYMRNLIDKRPEPGSAKVTANKSHNNQLA